MKVVTVFFCFLAVPISAQAAVVINEIAWMGSAVSANHEWIELANDGEFSVDLSGWTLTAEDGSPEIALSGMLAPGGFLLLERTSDESVPGISSDLVYTGALANSGETLMLRNADGVIVDTVIGGTNWVNIGGDHATKDTAQRTASGWITALGTPRAANATASSASAPLESAGEVRGVTTVSTNTSSGGTHTTAFFPRKTITISAGEDREALAGFPITLSGEARGLYDEPIPAATYQWNFGDGAIALGQTATHTYLFPGTYIATLEVFWGGKRERDRVMVSVSAPDIQITKVVPGPHGYIAINNASPHEVVVGGWRIVEGDIVSTIPRETIIPGGATLLLANQYTGLRGMNALTLESSDGLFLTTWKPLPTSTLPVLSKQRVNQSSVTSPNASFSQEVSGLRKDIGTSTQTVSAHPKEILWERPHVEQEAAGAAFVGGTLFSWLFIVGILAFALLTFFLLRRNTTSGSSTEGYAIIEEIIEGADDHHGGKRGGGMP